MQYRGCTLSVWRWDGCDCMLAAIVHQQMLPLDYSSFPNAFTESCDSRNKAMCTQHSVCLWVCGCVSTVWVCLFVSVCVYMCVSVCVCMHVTECWCVCEWVNMCLLQQSCTCHCPGCGCQQFDQVSLYPWSFHLKQSPLLSAMCSNTLPSSHCRKLGPLLSPTPNCSSCL